ncbi:MAG TPA: efflux RND transporter periplasmic adaptor subunit [Terriglobales bacterium]|nr:efflux RND transporter periplasmic adaptor subunit [Terriglobales bacterium]
MSAGSSTPKAVSIAAPAEASAIKREPLEISGPLVVEHEVDVAAQRDGIVTRILAEPGQRVRAGDLLAQLDDQQLSSDLEAQRAKTRSIEADLKNWEAEAKVMQSDYERAKKMWDADIITKEQLEHAQFKAESERWDIQRVRELLTNSRQQERSLELELEKTRIRAPFAGLVARRYVRAGQQVAKNDRLFWVTAEAPLLLRFTLPEKFLGHIRKGQQLALTSPDFPDEKHMSQVTAVSPVVDPASGTVEVVVELIGSSGQLRPGMTASVRLDALQ